MSLKLPQLLASLVLLTAQVSFAQDTAQRQFNERCASRVSISLLGKAPSAAVMASADPQSNVDAMLADNAFIERFARFVNSRFNDDPGASSEEDAAYHLSKEVLATGKAWKELFVGPYKVAKNSTGAVVVTADPNGLGYFRSLPWLRRYAGNEPEGYKLTTAYRIMNNTIGLHLVASTNAPDADVGSATRTTNAQCKVCHQDSFFALDKVARVLTKRVGTGDAMTFEAPTEVPQEILGTSIRDDRELVETLVNSPNFNFRACRLAFEFLYGRAEGTCEGPAFDRCMDAFAADGTIQSALRAVAVDATFCQ